MQKIFISLIFVLFLGGCASILAGKSQTITVESNPTDARCELLREGRVIATVEHTPGAVKIDKTKHDIDVICKKQGFAESKQNAHSGNEGYTLGNIILSGGIGWAVDSAVGADNKYPDVVTVNLASPDAIAEATSGPPATGLASKLAELKKLKDEGVISNSEYKAKRQELVSKF